MPGTYVTYALDFLLALAGGAAVFAYWLANRRRLAAEIVGRAEEQAARLLREAERDAESHRKEVLLDAKERAHELRVDAERYGQEQRAQVAREAQLVAQREAAVEGREREVELRTREATRRESAVDAVEAAVADSRRAVERLQQAQQQQLERTAGMSAAEARDLLLQQIEHDARREAAALVKRLEQDAREDAAARARRIVTEAIQRSAPELAVETTVSVVDLPGDDMKGRIIGREGRNIRALELATGVDLIVDDTPGAILLSSFDPHRRELAKRVIERLIADGRVHPARIEEVVDRVKAELEDDTRRAGEEAAFALGIGDLAPELVRLMGRLQFRTSYGQNVLQHSTEVASLAGAMARELGLDASLVVRAAFLHDIGKAIDRDQQGTHVELGVEVLRRHGESDAVVQAVAAHHMDIDWPSAEAMIVQAADAISASRPGARRDILAAYIQRLEKLERLADSFAGVSKAFALQAGREIRILVEAEKVTDEEAVWLSRDIARRIEAELEYPGQIKVTVIRETRAVEYAR